VGIVSRDDARLDDWTPMPHPRRRLSEGVSIRVVVLTLTAGLLLAGCSGDDESSDAPRSPDASSEAPSPTTDAPSPTESGLTDDPTVSPATGPVLEPETGGIRLRLPGGWTLDDQQASFLVNGSAPRGKGRIFVDSFPALDPDVGLDLLARVSVDNGAFPRGSIQPHTTMAGVPVYHLAGKVGTEHVEEFGVIQNGDILTISFQMRGIPAHERQPLIDSVLATVEWL
jgi:hypothetical protein